VNERTFAFEKKPTVARRGSFFAVDMPPADAMVLLPDGESAFAVGGGLWH